MPSPFPGMDPWLESPVIWPDLHDALAGEIRRELNRILPRPFYARLESRPELGIVEDEGSPRRIVPDIAVIRPPGASEQSATATLPRQSISPSWEITVNSEAMRHLMVEIRDADQSHRLVTLIEIVSPSNKRPGPDRRSYLKKQSEILQSDASLVEIDLHRRGERLLPTAELIEFFDEMTPPPHYVALVNRAWRRNGGSNFQVFAWSVRDRLPCLPVPLAERREDAALDLQYVFEQAYGSGGYDRGAVDYSAPPDIPLEETDAAWASERISRMDAE